jgi:hypothetical protein
MARSLELAPALALPAAAQLAHQASHEVRGTVLDGSGASQTLGLE